MAADWFVAINGQQYGPFSSKQIREGVANGRITRATKIKKGTDEQWFDASMVPGLFQPSRTIAPQSFVTTNNSIERYKERSEGNSFSMVLVGFAALILIAVAGLGIWALSNGRSDNQTSRTASVKKVVREESRNNTDRQPSNDSTSELKEIERQRKELAVERAKLEREKAESQQREHEAQQQRDLVEQEAEDERRELDTLELLLKMQESPELYIDQEFEVDVKIVGVQFTEIDTVESPDGENFEVKTLKEYRVQLSAGPDITRIGNTIYFPGSDDQLIFVTADAELGREMTAKFSGIKDARVKFVLTERKYGVKAVRFFSAKNPLGVGIAKNYWAIISSAEAK